MRFVRNALPGKDCFFYGYIGTQSDKVVDAISTYMDILTDMPKDSTNLVALKAALKQAGQTAKPSMRGKAQTFEYWKLLGYKDDPAKINADADAYATKVRSEAEAEANKKIAESLTDNLIRFNEIKNWDGKLPTYMAGEGSTTVPVLQFGSEEKTAEGE